MSRRWFEVETSIGRLRGVTTPRGLAQLSVVRGRTAPPPGAERDDAHPAAREIAEYFAGRRREFATPVDLTGQPPFRRRVLEALLRVPYGETTTYGELARRAGNPRAARAVGQAVGANPVPVVVPCHRVLAAGGAIGGFGLGLPAKRTLLEIERI